MSKKSLSIVVISVVGVICGIYNIITSFEMVFLLSGIMAVILSIGLFRLWNWARIATIIFGSFIILLNILFMYGTWLHIVGYKQTWAFIGVIAYLPLLLWSIVTIRVLTRFKIKELFKKKEKNEKKLEDK